MKKFRFLDWEVYKDSRKLFSDVLLVVRRLPKEYRYELGSQIIRAALSIVLNIAEGSGKSSDKELNRFIDISLGSVNETVAAVDLLRENRFITPEEFQQIYQRLDSISNQLGGFKKQLSRQSSVISHKSGFTLVELLVSFGVLVLLSGLAIANWKGGSQNLTLARAAILVAQDIRKAEDFSLSGKPASCFASAPAGSLLGYGVFFTTASPASYIIFANCNVSASYDGVGLDELVETKTLEQGITLFSVLPSPLSILFLPPNPNVKIEPGNALLGTIILQNSQGKQKTIQVNTRGVIDIP